MARTAARRSVLAMLVVPLLLGAAPPPPAPPGCIATTSTFPATPGLLLVDNGTVASTIVVSGLDPVLFDVNVETLISHTASGDLDVTLTSPAGTTVTLTTDNASANDDVFAGTVWDDDANPDGVAPYAANDGLVTDHAYVNLTLASPLAPEEALAAFAGENPNGTWTLTVSDDSAGETGVLANWSLELTTLPAAPATTAATFMQSTPVPIVDVSTVTSTFVVTGAPLHLLDLNLRTFLEHDFPADLDVTLTSPAGTTVTLTTDNGGGGDGVFDGTLWDDDANPGGVVPYAANDGLVTDHTFADLTLASPLVPEEALGVFIGENPNGTWTLTISDDFLADVGTLQSWSLEMTGGSCPAPPGTVTVTHSASLDPVTMGSAGCIGDDNHFYRAFPLAAFPAIVGPFRVQSVDLGVQDAISTAGMGQPITVRLHTSSADPPTVASLTERAAVTFTQADQLLGRITVPISASFVPSEILVVEVVSFAGDIFFMGGNPAGQTGPSYLRAPGCVIDEITDVATLGFPNAGYVMAVNGFVCGNASLDPGEQCDDGNLLAGDCCAPVCQHEADGSACSDENACTSGDACATGACVAGAPVACAACEECTPAAGCAVAPRPSCKRPTVARRTALQLRDAAPDTRDRLAWRWQRDAAAAPSEFGDPTATGDYTLCAWDESGGAPSLLLRSPAPAGGTCGRKPCWRRLGKASRPRGFAYRDPDAAPGGLGSLVLKPQGIAATGKGPGLGLPGFDALGLPIRVQLQGPQAAQCWEATYSPAGTRKNAGGRFKATAD